MLGHRCRQKAKDRTIWIIFLLPWTHLSSFFSLKHGNVPNKKSFIGLLGDLSALGHGDEKHTFFLALLGDCLQCQGFELSHMQGKHLNLCSSFSAPETHSYHHLPTLLLAEGSLPTSLEEEGPKYGGVSPDCYPVNNLKS